MIRYNVLAFDDDPVFLSALKDEIRMLNKYNEKYTINIETTTKSRKAIKMTDDVLYDVFILDICCSAAHFFGEDEYDYQGYDLYSQLLDKYPGGGWKAKFIILSNLKYDTAIQIFNYQDIEYLYKQDNSCKNVALYLKIYFDKLFLDDSKEFSQKTMNILDTVSSLKQKAQDVLSTSEYNRFIYYLDRITDGETSENNKNDINILTDMFKSVKNGAEFIAAIFSIASFFV